MIFQCGCVHGVKRTWNVRLYNTTRMCIDFIIASWRRWSSFSRSFRWILTDASPKRVHLGSARPICYTPPTPSLNPQLEPGWSCIGAVSSSCILREFSGSALPVSPLHWSLVSSRPTLTLAPLLSWSSSISTLFLFFFFLGTLSLSPYAHTLDVTSRRQHVGEFKHLPLLRFWIVFDPGQLKESARKMSPD